MKRKWLLVSLFVGVGVAAAAAAVVTVQVLESIDQQVDEMGHQMATRASQVRTPDEWPFAVELLPSDELPEANSLDLQIRSIEFKVIELEDRENQEWIYLVGLFENGGQLLVRELEVEFRVLDLDGKELWTQHESQLTSGLVGYRPGDVIPLRVFLKPPIEKLEEHKIGKVEIIPLSIEAAPFSESKEGDVEIDFTWQQSTDPLMEVLVRARPVRDQEDARSSEPPALVYAVENVGEVAFQRLSLTLQWTDSTGVVQEEVCPIVTGPALQPGDQFLVACGSHAKREGLEPSLHLLGFD